MNYNLRIFILISLKVNYIVAQTSSCNQSATTINVILPQNTSASIPGNTTTAGNYYLCGPNTNLYDTSSSATGCRGIFLNSSCKFVTNTSGCLAVNYIYAKNTSTVIIKAGTQQNTFLYYETGATIIDQVGLGNTFSCTSISFPIVNCGVTSISESNALNSQFEFFPNPANDRLNLKFISNKKEFYKAQILNSTGKVVKEVDLTNSAQINIEDLPNGVYLLNLKSINSTSISKRFIIAR